MNKWFFLALAAYTSIGVPLAMAGGWKWQPAWALWFGGICGAFGMACSWVLVWMVWSDAKKRNDDSDDDTAE